MIWYYFLFIRTNLPPSRVSTSHSQNEQVFHELVPAVETLEPAPGIVGVASSGCGPSLMNITPPGVELVKPIVFQPVDKKTAGSDIFSRLVPMSAYEASSVYRYVPTGEHPLPSRPHTDYECADWSIQKIIFVL